MEEQVTIAFLPCGHLATCGQCAPAMKKCPICRKHVKGSLKTYLSWWPTTETYNSLSVTPDRASKRWYMATRSCH